MNNLQPVTAPVVETRSIGEIIDLYRLATSPVLSQDEVADEIGLARGIFPYLYTVGKMIPSATAIEYLYDLLPNLKTDRAKFEKALSRNATCFQLVRLLRQSLLSQLSAERASTRARDIYFSLLPIADAMYESGWRMQSQEHSSIQLPSVNTGKQGTVKMILHTLCAPHGQVLNYLQICTEPDTIQTALANTYHMRGVWSSLFYGIDNNALVIGYLGSFYDAARAYTNNVTHGLHLLPDIFSALYGTEKANSTFSDVGPDEEISPGAWHPD